MLAQDCTELWGPLIHTLRGGPKPFRREKRAPVDSLPGALMEPPRLTLTNAAAYPPPSLNAYRTAASRGAGPTCRIRIQCIQNEAQKKNRYTYSKRLAAGQEV